MSGPSFRIAGIPVRVDLTFILMAFLLGWGARTGGLLVAWMVIVTGSVLLHELGHAVAFRRFGQQPQILLQGMGGLTSGSGEPLSARRDIAVSLAGPLTGLVLLGLPALAVVRSTAELSPELKTVLSDLVFVNLGWSILNLLPILPLDGGRVSAALLSLRGGDRGQRQAHLLSAVVAGAAAAVALVAGYTFGALFAGFFCAFNVSQLSAGRNAGLQQRLADGWRHLADGDTRAAQDTAQGVLGDRPSGGVMGQASELLAWARLADGDAQGAQAAIQRFPHGTEPNAFLRAALDLEAGRAEQALDAVSQGYADRQLSPATPVAVDAIAGAGLMPALVDRLLAPGGPGPSALAELGVHLHSTGRFEEAAGVSERAFDAGADNSARVAYNAACSLARAGSGAAALGWLERAAGLGFDDVPLLDRDPDLDAIRPDDRFRQLRHRLELASPGNPAC